MLVGRARGQAVPTRSLNQKPHHSGQFRFSTPKVRPDPIGDSPVPEVNATAFWVTPKLRRACRIALPIFLELSRAIRESLTAREY